MGKEMGKITTGIKTEKQIVVDVDRYAVGSKQ